MISPEVLRRYPHFAGIADACLGEVAKISEELDFHAGEKLFEESRAFIATARIYEKGEEASHLMVLTKGKVDITLTLGSGATAIVGSLAAGDLMALSALIPPYHLTAAGVARDDGKYIRIKAPELRRLCDENPELGYMLMQGVTVGLMSRLQNTRVELAGESYTT